MGEGLTSDPQRSVPMQGEPADVLGLMLRTATLLFANGQTTERTDRKSVV